MTACRSTYGITAARLRLVGDGPSSPVVSNDNDAGRANNRRVELVKQ
jgi:outer membrane protein OmpA-like peptidoglycan-associated protein